MALAQRSPHLTQHCAYTDSTGLTWRVEERARPGDLGSETEFVLIFASLGAFRCIRHYPRDWFDLDHAELERLSWTT